MFSSAQPIDFVETEEKVVYLTPRRRSEVWLCAPVTGVSLTKTAEENTWGAIFRFKRFDKESLKVVINKRLINKSGVALAKRVANLGIAINPGYEKQFSSYLKAKLEAVAHVEVMQEVSGVKQV